MPMHHRQPRAVLPFRLNACLARAALAWVLAALVATAGGCAADATLDGASQQDRAAARTAPPRPGGRAVVTGTSNGLLLREGPSTDRARILTMPEGTVVEVRATAAPSWLEVDYAGTVGFANDGFLAATTEPATTREEADAAARSGPAIVRFAQQFLGTPYVHAGNRSTGIAPSAFDCSGFTNYVIFHTLGLEIWNSPESQWGYGSFVSSDALQPGDLVFYSDYASVPTHVGIYIGDNQMIHAANPGEGVTVTNIWASWYGERYWGARRM